MASTIRLLLAFLLCTTIAHANDKADAEAEMLKAQENLDRGEFEAAISRFNVARSLVPQSSGPYLGLGLAYARSGKCDQAVPYLEEYLRRKRQNPKPEAMQTLAECRSKFMPQTGRIVVTSDPAGAEVRFDDVQGPILGLTPFESQPLPPGRHRVFVAKSGYRGVSSEVAVNAGERANFTVALVAEAPTQPQSLTAPPRVQVEITPPPPEAPKPSGPPGKLVVEIAPVDAQVTVNGTRVATATRRYEGDQPAGPINILVEKDGYRAVATAISLGSGATEKRVLELKPLKKSAWLGVGIAFTALAVGTGAGAIATYVKGNDFPRDSADYHTDKNATLALQGVFYGTLAVAAVGYILYGVLNRGRVSDGPPLKAMRPGSSTIRF